MYHDNSAIHTCGMMQSNHLSSGPCRRRMTVLAVLMALVLAGVCRGDQLQWNPLTVSMDAAMALARQPLLVSFCSLADEDYIKLWLVRGAEIVSTAACGLYEVIASVKPQYQSARPYSSADFPLLREQWRFHKSESDEWLSVGIDLAYVYIHTGGGSFRCLAEVLGLDCVMGVQTMRLPRCVMRDIVASLGGKCCLTPWPPTW